MKIINTTLALLVKEDRILLALKKRGFAKNKYNGIGGNPMKRLPMPDGSPARKAP